MTTLNTLVTDPQLYNNVFKPNVVHHLKKFQPNEKVLVQGQYYSHFYYILEGIARVVTKAEFNKFQNMSNIVIELGGDNKLIGIFSLFDDKPAGATVVAVSELTTFEIDNASFIDFISNEPTIGYQICKGLLREYFHRLREANKTVSNLTATVIDLQNQLSLIKKTKL